MRILIVNAHPNSQTGQKGFNRFFDCVKEALRIYKDFLDVEDGCLVRTMDNLDDFLYGEKGTYSSKSSAKRFDALDIIIISGDSSLVPWSPLAAKMITLVRMCIQVKKCLFACGTAMDALVYLSATNLDSPIRVINGNGKGTKLGEINGLPVPEIKLGEIACFLDATTGDLYTLRHQSGEWLPLCNLGLHNIRVAQEYNTLGKYVIQAPVYRPNKMIEDRTQNNRFYESHEVLCYVKKHHSNHWLFADCGLEFIVPHKSKWQVHSFTFMNIDKTFEVIADSKEGPLIIEYTNIIGVKFDLDRKYPETLKVLCNFLTKYSKDIMAINRKASLSIRQELEIKYNRTEHFVFSSPEKNKFTSASESICLSDRGNMVGIKFSKFNRDNKRGNTFQIRHMKHNSLGAPGEFEEIRHSGYAMKKSGIQIQNYNYIAPGKVPLEAQQTPRQSIMHKKNNVSAIINELFNSSQKSREPSLAERQVYSVVNSPGGQNMASGVLKDAFSSRFLHRKMSAQDGELTDFIDETPRNRSRNDSIDVDAVVTKELARKMLYPELPDLKAAFEKRSWVPGSMSSRRREDSPEERLVKVIKVNRGKEHKSKTRTMTTREDTNPYKTIRASCPYQTAYDINKEYEKKEREKILGSRVFITSSKMIGSRLGSRSNMAERMSSTAGFNLNKWP